MLGMIKIMEAYLPLVKQIVDRIDVKLPQHWDKEDMIGYGMLGLMEAIKRFKPEKGVQFSTFASIRIKGAILDALRKDTPLPRTLWQKVRRITETMEQIYQVTGQEASIEVVAEKLGMGKSEVEEALEAYRLLSHISLEQSLGFSDSYEMTVADTLESKTWEGVEAQILEKEQKEQLTRAIAELDERQRLVLTLYFYEELTLKEIAQVLDLGVSRISQIKTMALANLRKKLHNAMLQEI
ncbi:MAG: sigma-70 family RNA polymerase sigma factor [Syntrophomonadaceae bacterium]|jgi:RNA polymerase sigma factor for flagellar operon FliA